jgi:hypothetical protein
LIGSRQLGIALLVGLGLAVPPLVLSLGDTAEAEFGVSQTLGLNRIETATLDIEVGQSIAEISAEAMAPGDRRQLEVTLRNAGSLPLAFNMRVLPNNSQLAEVLNWEQWDGPCDERPVAPREPVPANQLSGEEEITMLLLGLEQQTTACFAAILPIDAPNDLQAAVAGYDVIVDAIHDIDKPNSADKFGFDVDLGTP